MRIDTKKAELCADPEVLGAVTNRSAAAPRHSPPLITPLCQRLNVMMTRWHRLIQLARNPYRPERHYMRGPGPKWYAKHQGRTKNGPL